MIDGWSPGTFNVKDDHSGSIVCGKLGNDAGGAPTGPSADALLVTAADQRSQLH
jgi:hypothetical protein